MLLKKQIQNICVALKFHSLFHLFIYLFIHSSIHSLRLTYANFYEPINVSNNTENETKS